MQQLTGTRALSDPTMTLLEHALDLRAERHTLIASNIANAETPRYQAVDLAFEGTLKEAMSSTTLPAAARTHPRHFAATGMSDRVVLGADLVYRKSAGVANDRNSVDLDTEMAQLAHNNLLYNATAQMLSKKFAGIRQAIDGGKM
jgi:flagellar basal-body rod protein FlgB